jgi:hypothetical protein
MTHEPERDYDDVVAQFFRDAFGPQWVDDSVELPSGRRPDMVVQTPLQTAYVEVENDAEATIHGAGQAVLYAGEGIVEYGEQALPVVVSPHWDYPEHDFLQQFVVTVTVPTDYESGDLDA